MAQSPLKASSQDSEQFSVRHPHLFAPWAWGLIPLSWQLPEDVQGIDVDLSLFFSTMNDLDLFAKNILKPSPAQIALQKESAIIQRRIAERQSITTSPLTSTDASDVPPSQSLEDRTLLNLARRMDFLTQSLDEAWKKRSNVQPNVAFQALQLLRLFEQFEGYAQPAPQPVLPKFSVTLADETFTLDFTGQPGAWGNMKKWAKEKSTAKTLTLQDSKFFKQIVLKLKTSCAHKDESTKNKIAHLFAGLIETHINSEALECQRHNQAPPVTLQLGARFLSFTPSQRTWETVKTLFVRYLQDQAVLSSWTDKKEEMLKIFREKADTALGQDSLKATAAKSLEELFSSWEEEAFEKIYHETTTLSAPLHQKDEHSEINSSGASSAQEASSSDSQSATPLEKRTSDQSSQTNASSSDSTQKPSSVGSQATTTLGGLELYPDLLSKNPHYGVLNHAPEPSPSTIEHADSSHLPSTTDQETSEPIERDVPESMPQKSSSSPQTSPRLQDSRGVGQAKSSQNAGPAEDHPLADSPPAKDSENAAAQHNVQESARLSEEAQQNPRGASDEAPEHGAKAQAIQSSTSASIEKPLDIQDHGLLHDTQKSSSSPLSTANQSLGLPSPAPQTSSSSSSPQTTPHPQGSPLPESSQYPSDHTRDHSEYCDPFVLSPDEQALVGPSVKATSFDPVPAGSSQTPALWWTPVKIAVASSMVAGIVGGILGYYLGHSLKLSLIAGGSSFVLIGFLAFGLARIFGTSSVHEKTEQAQQKQQQSQSTSAL